MKRREFITLPAVLRPWPLRRDGCGEYRKTAGIPAQDRGEVQAGMLLAPQRADGSRLNVAMPKGVTYRPDIDGLRAVAIVPVVLYHAGFRLWGGGFVGVDVFFVISGYLIASLILAEIHSGTFTLRNFYVRRIRRIFPALFTMMAGSAAIGVLLLTPRDFQRLGESIAATTLFSSNALFWSQSGYFAAPSEEWPLLHTWSLGVEEQFYLAFPVLLLLVYRFFPGRLIWITLAFCLLSLGLNVLTVKAHPNFAFYLAPPRVWELLVGVLLALGVAAPSSSNRWSEAAGFAGAGLIGCAVFGFSQNTKFPGFAALVPALGSALIIWAGIGGKGTVARLLSHRAMVLVGKISYSLYLWHFPLLAFAAYAVTGGASPLGRLSILAVSVVIASASWLYVEQPVRQGRGVFGQGAAVFTVAAAAIALFGGLGLTSFLAHGFPGRISEPGLQIAAAADEINADRAACLYWNPTDVARRQRCTFGVASMPSEFALWGDSHAESLRAAFDTAAKKAGRAGGFFGTGGCIPELGIERDNFGCDRVNESIVAHLVSLPSIHTVILAGRWVLWAEGSFYKDEGGKSVSLISRAGKPMESHAAFAAGVEAAVVKLLAAGKKIWLVGPIPEVGYNVPRDVYVNWLGLPQTVDIRPSIEEFNNRQRFVFTFFASLARQYPVQTVWPHQYLCDARFCAVQKNEKPLYVDDQHLARSAAIAMAAIFDPIFAGQVREDSPVAK
jgi:peptidoglycan/LPS O-acetylase OafA/YrhL